ncbi:Sulfoquinovosyl transferase SQD2 (Protein SULFOQUINOVOSYLDIACYLGLYCEROL 2) (Sulfolipid synthase SQD2) (UDP-sulfoquinovose: diacylglycerol alpha-sulfoquinovosyltransferase SQD2) [Durusdinium trenchii]|uniref:Sulfoquinovosyl transferase SQD2 (Protein SULFOQUINOVOSYLDIACYLGLYCEROL 2) (Sulfolipid synthase SQD2) (UDP-sulfoquinovose: diacylglycerol alpha-sulfoquinovosyltransferase SQD2) n=1 Tax=Durusdinium trenchii TaxID=1381693 RepID=A0ABP0PMH3_9DINO
MRNSCSGQLEEVRSVRSKQDALLHGSRSSRLLAQWKHTVTPILILSCLLQFRWPTALLYATAVVLVQKLFRLGLLKLCWAGCPRADQPMRVLLSGDSFPPKLDGVQNFARNTIQALVRDGHQVHVFCSNGTSTTHLAPESFGATVTRGPGVEVQPKHKITLQLGAVIFSGPSPHFVLSLMRFRPHVIQFFDFTPCAFFVVPFLWWLGIPLIISHHSRIDLYATYVPGFIGDYAPQVIRAVCEVMFPLVTGHLLIDGSQKDQSWFQGHPNLRFWSTGCDLNFFHPSKAKPTSRELCSNHRPDLPLVVFVGRLSPEKQVDKLVDLVKVTNPPGERELCRFAIIGNGDSWESIHAEIGERPDVYMPGAVVGEELASAVASADIFFSPTVTGTLDLVFIESQAAGLAVVGPRAVAVVADGENGRLYDPLDMEDAKRAIKDIIDGKSLEQMKVAARANAAKNFTWSKCSEEAIQLLGLGFYKDVLQPLTCELCKSIYPTYIHTNSGHERSPLVEVPNTTPPFIVLENMVRDSQQHTSRGLHVISLAEKELKLGRGHESDVRIADAAWGGEGVSISRCHATIRFSKGQFLLQDNSSKFGTLVAMKKPKVLEPGVNISIQMGRTVLTLCAQSDPNQSTAAPPAGLGGVDRTGEVM